MQRLVEDNAGWFQDKTVVYWEDEPVTAETPDSRSAHPHGETPVRRAPALPGQSPAAPNQEVPLAPPGSAAPASTPRAGQERQLRPAPMVPAAGQERAVQPAPGVPTGQQERQLSAPSALPRPAARQAGGEYPIHAAPSVPMAAPRPERPMAAPQVPMRPAPAVPQPQMPQPGAPAAGFPAAGRPVGGIPAAGEQPLAPVYGAAYPAAAPTAVPAGVPFQGGVAQGQPPYGQPVPMATPAWGQPVATPPPLAPPSFVGGTQPAQSSASAWPVQPQPSPAPGVSNEAKGQQRSSKARSVRRSRRVDSSYLALMFLAGAAFFLLGVVIVVVIALSV